MSSFITLLLLIIGRDVYAAEILLRKSSASYAQQNFFLMKENQRLEKEIQRLREINKRPKWPQQHNLIDNNIGRIADTNISPSYALLEIGMQKKKLQAHVDARVHARLGPWDFIDAAKGVAGAAGGAIQGAAGAAGGAIQGAAGAAGGAAGTAAGAVGGAAGTAAGAVGNAAGTAANAVGGAIGGKAQEIAQDGLKNLVSELKRRIRKLIGHCDAACFRAVKDATQARIQEGAGQSIHIVYIGQTAFNHFKEEGGGLKKMLIGLVYNSLNGLFDWAMPDIRRYLRSQYAAQVRPIFRSKTVALQKALLEHSSSNIFDVLQGALVDSMRHSIHSACSILPDVSWVLEIDFPPYCVIIVEQVLRDLRWVRGIAISVAKVVDDTIKDQASKSVFNDFHDSLGTGSKRGTKGTAKSIVQWLDQPIGTILSNEFKKFTSAIKEIAVKVFPQLKDEAEAMAKISCHLPEEGEEGAEEGEEDVMCKLDTIANLFFLLFDKKNMQHIMSQMLYEKMAALLYEDRVFDFLFHAFDEPVEDPVPVDESNSEVPKKSAKKKQPKRRSSG